MTPKLDTTQRLLTAETKIELLEAKVDVLRRHLYLALRVIAETNESPTITAACNGAMTQLNPPRRQPNTDS